MAHAQKLQAKRTSPFKSAGASVQSTTGSRGVRISGSNAGYTVFRGSVKSTGYPLHSPVSPSLPFPRVTVCHQVSNALYFCSSSAPAVACYWVIFAFCLHSCDLLFSHISVPRFYPTTNYEILAYPSSQLPLMYGSVYSTPTVFAPSSNTQITYKWLKMRPTKTHPCPLSSALP
jgi:hypothetical protein